MGPEPFRAVALKELSVWVERSMARRARPAILGMWATALLVLDLCLIAYVVLVLLSR